MNEEQRSAMIGALEAAFAQVGIDMYSGAQRLSALIDSHRPLIQASCSRESLSAYLDSAGNQDEATVAIFVALISAWPGLASQFVQTTMHNIAATMPKAPVGRPPALTSEQRREAVERIARLYTSGTTIGTAQLRVAQQLGVSKRTVQASWQQRRQLTEQPFQTMQDVWNLVGKLVQPTELEPNSSPSCSKMHSGPQPTPPRCS